MGARLFWGLWLLGALLWAGPSWSQTRGAATGVGSSTPESSGTEPAPLTTPRDFMRRYDRNRDGKITRQEYGDGVRFARMDLDQDGALSGWEVELYHLRTRQAVEQFIRERDKDSSGGLSRAELPLTEGLFAQLDLNSDRLIDTQELWAITRYWARQEGEETPVVRPPRAPGRPDPEAMLRERLMARWDLNQDGKITREEFQGPAQIWNHLDADGDGVVTIEELVAAQERFSRDSRQLMQDLDTDGDGRISRREFRGSDELFQLMDRNRDGYIDEADRSLPAGPQLGEATGRPQSASPEEAAPPSASPEMQPEKQ